MQRFAILMLATVLTFVPTTLAFAEASPTEIARQYFEAVEGGDLDSAGALFASTSSVFETGGQEGDWEHYRTHHLGAEIDAIEQFEIRLADPESESSADGSMAFVTWPIEYHIRLTDGREIESRGTVTFVLVENNGAYRIRHLHWSSRRMS